MSKALFRALVCLPLVATVSATAYAQSLADVAKKEEERRKTVKEPAKVYTNKDLVAVPAGSPTPPSSAATSDADKDKAKAESTDTTKAAADDKSKEPPAQVKDEKYWKGRMQTLQTALDRDQGYVEAIQTRINALTADFVNRDDPAQRAVIERDRNKALAELDRLKKQIVDDKKAISDFDEEARRAGVPPGWLR